MKTWHKLVTTYSKMQPERWASHRICIKIWCGDYFVHRVLDLWYHPLNINNLWVSEMLPFKFRRWLQIAHLALLWFCFKKTELMFSVVTENFFPRRSEVVFKNPDKWWGTSYFHLWLGLFNSALSAFALIPNKIKFSNVVC